MSIQANIKKIREKKGLKQVDVAEELGIGYTNYNKMENGVREPSVKELQMLAKLFGLTIDQLVNYSGSIPKESSIQDKAAYEQLNLIKQLDKEEKEIIFKLIDTMLTKKKFQEFFKQNIDGK